MISTAEILKRAKAAATYPAAETEKKNKALLSMADFLVENTDKIGCF